MELKGRGTNRTPTHPYKLNSKVLLSIIAIPDRSAVELHDQWQRAESNRHIRDYGSRELPLLYAAPSIYHGALFKTSRV